jgi:hypothetical protein
MAQAESSCRDQEAWYLEQDYGGEPFLCANDTENHFWFIYRGDPSDVRGAYFYDPPPECELPDTLYQDESGQMVCGTPPPSCDSPNYIDVVSGECVSPEEICYTNLESMADECVLIGSPEAENCVTDQSGLQLCLGDNPLCYQANGKTVCPDSDSVCGEKNGTFQCVSPEEEGCGLFNGERVCFTPDGDKVDPDSPDHPDNGGNLDGDQNNDVTDSRSPEEGGDPENQPNQSLPTTDADRASEKTAKDSLNELRKINDGLKKNTQAVKDTADQFREEVSQSELDSIQQNGASGSWDDPATGTWADVDGYSDDISDTSDDYGVGMLDGIGDTTSSLIDQGTCQNLGWNFQGHVFELGCDKTQKIRDLLSWVFYILTVWALFDIVTTPVTRPN